MALVLRLLPLLLSRAQGDAPVSLDGRPGDRVNLSCAGVSHPIRWAWAPSFPACKGLSKGRRPILWASPSGTPTASPVQPFAGRLRVLGPGIRRLELLLSAGDSGTFICRGRHEDDESRTALQVMGDAADCRAPGPSQGSVYPQLLIALLGAGLALGLGVLGVVWWQRRRRSPPHPLRPFPRFGEPGPALFSLYAYIPHASIPESEPLPGADKLVTSSQSFSSIPPRPPHSSTSKSRAPEASRGGGAQDCRGHGPGAEPAVCKLGPYGLQKTPPVVASGPRRFLHHLCGCSLKQSPYLLQTSEAWAFPITDSLLL